MGEKVKLNGLNIISLGLGVQSSAMYYMSSMGVLPRADYAVFADLGAEKDKTYRNLDYMLNWQKENSGIPIVVIQKKNLYLDLIHGQRNGKNGFVSIPAFVRNSESGIGMIKRQCTGDYKVRQVDDEIRNLYKLKKGAHRPLTKVWIGISLDEMSRMRTPGAVWKVHSYPFIGYEVSVKGAVKVSEMNYTRSDIVKWLTLQGLPVPVKSSCVFCPFMSDNEWSKLAGNELERVKLVEKAINVHRKGRFDSELFLHRSLEPIDRIKFDQEDLFTMGNCSDMCNL